MKKLLLSAIAATTISLTAFGQCDPSNHNAPFDPDSNSWVFPTSLPCVERGIAYSQTLYIKFPDNGEDFGYPDATIDSVEVTSIIDLPGGLIYTPDQTDLVWDGGSFGCVVLEGTTLDSIGEYLPTIEVLAYVSLFGNPSGTQASEFNLGINVITPGDDCIPVSVNELYENAEVNVYPQPASDQLFFDINQEKLNGELTIELINVLGEVVLQTNTYMNKSIQQVVDVSTLPQGTYFFKASMNNTAVATGKFVVSK